VQSLRGGAASEPDRADYQVDLGNSLVRASDPSANRSPFERALAILRALDAEGRLALADLPKIARLEEMLGNGSAAPAQ
jgi:hypothetical protein